MAALVLTALSISPVFKEADQSECAVSASSNYLIHCTIDRKRSEHICQSAHKAVFPRYGPFSPLYGSDHTNFCLILFVISLFLFPTFSGRNVS